MIWEVSVWDVVCLKEGFCSFDENICVLGLKKRLLMLLIIFGPLGQCWENGKNAMFGYIWVISVINDIYYENMKLSGNNEIGSLWGRMVELDSLITHLWKCL